MTAITELTNEVLLEIKNRITELKAEQLIDERCVVVDTIANIRGELKDCCECNKVLEDDNFSLRETINDMAKKHVRYKNTIKELKDQNIEDLKEMYDFREGELEWFKDRITENDETIVRMRSVFVTRKLDAQDLACVIRDLTSQLTEKRTIINEITRLRVNEVETRQDLEAELSARKQDSEILMKVVKVIEDDSVGNNKAANLIADIVGYYDAPEGPEDTSLDEVPTIVVTCGYLELP